MGYFSTGGGGGLASVVQDLSPQLGGNLDVNSKSIVSTAAGNIVVTPDTTGSIMLDGLAWPQADGTIGQILKTNGAGTLSWVTGSGAISSVFGRAGIVVSANGDYSASQVSNTPAGNIIATTVQAAIAELDAEKAATIHTHVKADVTDFAHTHTTADITGGIVFNGLTYPAIDGANGEVMTTNGAGSLSWSAISGGGEVSVDSGTMTIAPTAGGIVDCVAIGNGAIIAAGSVESIAIGKSRANGIRAFAAMINNNTASYGAQNTGAIAIGEFSKALNWSCISIGSGCIAIVPKSFSVGYYNTANGNASASIGGNNNIASGGGSTTIGGINNVASGLNSANLGGSSNAASGAYSSTSGTFAVADKHGHHASCSGIFSAVGDSQISTLLARNATTNATATELFLDGATAKAVLPASRTWAFNGLVSARQTGGTAGTAGDSATWEIKGAIKRDAANNTLLVGTPVVTSLGADAASAAWSIAVAADDINESLKLTFTGELNKNINITAALKLAECGG